MTAKPIPAWAMNAARGINLCLDGGCCTESMDPSRLMECGCVATVARLLVATRKAALREALRLVKAHLGDGECHDICDCGGYFDKSILALIDKEPS